MQERLLFPYKEEMDIQQYYEKLHLIYSRIVDDVSKKIYTYRLLMTFTGDISYIRKLVLLTEPGVQFKEFLKKQSKIYVYGAGVRGTRVVQMFPEMNWVAYIDERKEGVCNNVPIIKIDNLILEDKAIILITNQVGANNIKKDIISKGIVEDAIVILNDFEDMAQKNRYFEKRCIENFKKSRGAFVDAGCFDGEDCIAFLNSILNENGNIFAFEPDINNYVNCIKRLKQYERVKVYNIGLADQKQQVYFRGDGGVDSRISEEGDYLVDIDTIDSVLSNENIGFIKMDIEGSEKKALLGARTHIEKEKPNMMISVYHKVQDIIEIPVLLLEMNPNYRFALGHYTTNIGDTILYVFE